MKRFINQTGSIPTLLVIALVAVGVLAYVLVTQLAPFKDNLLNILYPKKESEAATNIPDNQNSSEMKLNFNIF